MRQLTHYSSRLGAAATARAQETSDHLSQVGVGIGKARSTRFFLGHHF